MTASPVPQTPEPTDEQRAVAMVACGHRGWTVEQLSLTQRERVHAVARALAAAVQQERDKVLAALDDTQPDPSWDELYIEGYRDATRDAARRIREVSR